MPVFVWLPTSNLDRNHRSSSPGALDAPQSIPDILTELLHTQSVALVAFPPSLCCLFPLRLRLRLREARNETSRARLKQTVVHLDRPALFYLPPLTYSPTGCVHKRSPPEPRAQSPEPAYYATLGSICLHTLGTDGRTARALLPEPHQPLPRCNYTCPCRCLARRTPRPRPGSSLLPSVCPLRHLPITQALQADGHSASVSLTIAFRRRWTLVSRDGTPFWGGLIELAGAGHTSAEQSSSRRPSGSTPSRTRPSPALPLLRSTAIPVTPTPVLFSSNLPLLTPPNPVFPILNQVTRQAFPHIVQEALLRRIPLALGALLAACVYLNLHRPPPTWPPTPALFSLTRPPSTSPLPNNASLDLTILFSFVSTVLGKKARIGNKSFSAHCDYIRTILSGLSKARGAKWLLVENVSESNQKSRSQVRRLGPARLRQPAVQNLKRKSPVLLAHVKRR